MGTTVTPVREQAVRIPSGGVWLDGDLALPANARGLIIFAHGSGSGRFSPRNRYVAATLHKGGFGTLLLDLLTRDEERVDEFTREFRFDIPRLAARMVSAVDWARATPEVSKLPIGLFGASTGAAAALIAAAERPREVRAVVSRGGRPDLAGEFLGSVEAPTLLIVGGLDTEVLRLNHAALRRLGAVGRLEIVSGATHLFEEPGALDEVCRLARDWFERHLTTMDSATTAPGG